ncbi:MAG: hypothetical protein A2X51_00565 [Candidatus Rokubacteria bacterium GWC2_70_24]|nr:MAG: hypothetical protein A2X50_07490 [Candidatus Rokubacteria bacterium GWF2_70_14]OGK90184.1 MAG: hypothetical protein A2X51_00565 [Candidatus Rokubacteria bacterium GWC2_70_24]
MFLLPGVLPPGQIGQPSAQCRRTPTAGGRSLIPTGTLRAASGLREILGDADHHLLQTPTWCRERATEIGPACRAFIGALLGDRPLDRPHQQP